MAVPAASRVRAHMRGPAQLSMPAASRTCAHLFELERSTFITSYCHSAEMLAAHRPASCIVTSSWTVTYFTPHDRSSAICTTPEDCSDVQGRRLWTSNSDTCATRTPRFLSIHRVIPRWCLLGRCVVVRGNRMIEACGTVRLERDHGITPVWLPVAI